MELTQEELFSIFKNEHFLKEYFFFFKRKVRKNIILLLIILSEFSLYQNIREKVCEYHTKLFQILVYSEFFFSAETNLHTPTDDLFLLAFLRSRKFNVKKAFKLLQNYWSFRREYSNIYDFTENEPVIKIFQGSYIGFLPYRDRNGCCVVVTKSGEHMLFFFSIILKN